MSGIAEIGSHAASTAVAEKAGEAVSEDVRSYSRTSHATGVSATDVSCEEITAGTIPGDAVCGESAAGRTASAGTITGETGAAAGTAVGAAAGTAVGTAVGAAMGAAMGAARPAPPGMVLPVPPDDNEKYCYIRHGAWIMAICAIASFPLVVYSQCLLMADYHWYLLCAPFVLLGVIFLALPLVTDGMGRGFDLESHNRLVTGWRPHRYPSVDVFLPVCGEPLPVLRNTWTHVARMARHYRGTVVPYVLDDSASPAIKAMAAEFGFVYATRPNRGWYKKSGNLWFGFRISAGEFILLLDADFAPRHDLLDETLPYLDASPDLGIVQTPQYFHVVDDQTWVERGAGAVQELFYRSIQTVRSPKGGAICVGSCAVYRRTALADNEGMTLADHSEDVLTGFDLNKLGWRLRYIPLALSTGNCPDNVVAFLNQQYRWCSGTVGLLFARRFWQASLPLLARLSYMAGLVYYLYTAIFTFVIPLLTISLLAFEPRMLILRNMAFMLPAMLYSAVVFPLWHQVPYRLEAWAVKLIAGWAHFFAYWDAVRGKPLGWKPTGSDRRKQDGSRRFWACFVGWTLGSSLVWTGLALWRMMTMDPVNFAVLLALGVFELMVAARVLIQPASSAS